MEQTGRAPVSSKAAFQVRGGDTNLFSEEEEELKLSPREVSKRPTAVPHTPPRISEQARERAAKGRRDAVEAARRESERERERNRGRSRSGDSDHHIRWKDEVPGGEHRLTEGSVQVPWGKSDGVSGQGGGSSRHKPTGKGKRSSSGEKKRREERPGRRKELFRTGPEPSPPTVSVMFL